MSWKCSRCEVADANEDWGGLIYCTDCYRFKTQQFRAKIEHMADLYEELRTDVHDNLQLMLAEYDAEIMTEKRFITADLHLPDGIRTIEYDTLTTTLTDITEGMGKALENHRYST
jgi:hypothetical protein